MKRLALLTALLLLTACGSSHKISIERARKRCERFCAKHGSVCVTPEGAENYFGCFNGPVFKRGS